MTRYLLTVDAAGYEAAVHGLVATTDAGAALLARLELLLDGPVNDTTPAPRRPVLSREAVAAALRETGGNVSAAARALGYARATVREKATLYVPLARAQ
jgi:transcriptional regulator of acetoin/glycerol metabolism